MAGPARCPAVVRLEDARAAAPICDFANKFIGGGVLGRGCVQEEILFVIYPESLVSLMFTPEMAPREAVHIVGTMRSANYSGYASSFRFAGEAWGDAAWGPGWKLTGEDSTGPSIADEAEDVNEGNIEFSMIAVDALCFSSATMQIADVAVAREMIKLAAGLAAPTATAWEPLPSKSSLSGCVLPAGALEAPARAPLAPLVPVLPRAELTFADTLQYPFKAAGDRDVVRTSRNPACRDTCLCNTVVSPSTADIAAPASASSQHRGPRPRVWCSAARGWFATGNWGCGAFRGEHQLKCVIQLLVCGAMGKAMQYFTLDAPELPRIHAFLCILYANRVSLAELSAYLRAYLRGHQAVSFGDGVDPTDAVVKSARGAIGGDDEWDSRRLKDAAQDPQARWLGRAINKLTAARLAFAKAHYIRDTAPVVASAVDSPKKVVRSTGVSEDADVVCIGTPVVTQKPKPAGPGILKFFSRKPAKTPATDAPVAAPAPVTSTPAATVSTSSAPSTVDTTEADATMLRYVQVPLCNELPAPEVRNVVTPKGYNSKAVEKLFPFIIRSLRLSRGDKYVSYSTLMKQ
jgi:hypothetical protein